MVWVSNKEGRKVIAEMSLGAVGAFSPWFGGRGVGGCDCWAVWGVANVAASREGTRNDAPSTDLGRGEVNVPVIGLVSLS